MEGRSASETLKDKLVSVIQPGESVLFAGAGVGARAGLVDWKNYLRTLAREAGKHEKAVEKLMLSRIKAKQYLNAAHLFKRVLQIPEGERYRILSEPFVSSRYDAKMLSSLMSLPFRGIATPNYDRSLLDALSTVRGRHERGAPMAIERGEGRFKVMHYEENYFARLHGRAEKPDSIVLDDQDYEIHYQDRDFLDGLLGLLRDFSCIFIGFSFVDPAIDAVLNCFSDIVGPDFPKLHTAFVPKGSDDLTPKLHQANIDVVEYDPADNHREFWSAVDAAASSIHSITVSEGPSEYIGLRKCRRALETIRKALAMCYARTKLSKDTVPLRRLVLQGLQVAELAKREGKEAPVEEVHQSVAKVLGASIDEARPSLVKSFDQLCYKEICDLRDGHAVLLADMRDDLSGAFNALAKSVIRRARLRTGIQLEQHKDKIGNLLRDLILSSGFDLGAHFASRAARPLGDVLKRIQACVEQSGLPVSLRKHAVDAVAELLRSPNGPEADILAMLGRLAFGVELALGQARSSILYAEILPSRVYLDASILLPAIVDGHPRRPLLAAALDSLGKALASQGIRKPLYAPHEFLNEVVSHRERACAIVKQLDLEQHSASAWKPTPLFREINLKGADGTNVFIGAYASWIGRLEKQVSFNEFLELAAPYETEDQLQQYLDERNFSVVHLSKGDPSFKPTKFWEVFNRLKLGYEETIPQWDRLKPTVLIEHEAWQLLQLDEDHSVGIRSLFATADRKLGRAVKHAFGARETEDLLSDISLVQLVDTLIGVPIDSQAMTRMIWGVQALDPEDTVRHYITNVGLRIQGDVETLALPQVVENLMKETKISSEWDVVYPQIGADTDRARETVAKFLDRLEDRFYELLEEAVKKRENE